MKREYEILIEEALDGNKKAEKEVMNLFKTLPIEDLYEFHAYFINEAARIVEKSVVKH